MQVQCVDRSPLIARELAADEMIDPLDQQLCEIVGAVLHKHYPLYDWLVQADRRKGFVDIRNVSLDGQLGCRILMNGPASVSELEHKAMMYGGEILERFNVHRGAMRSDEMDALEKDFAGRVINVDRN